ncbi:hypothetical protein [Oceanobacillus sp. FSL K6-0251]|uniref:hypothetical protein n=1 Tax=Oceanobacillus sp. FSL K6-0251 TaxID=2921602 RepID=UPI0030FBF956
MAGYIFTLDSIDSLKKIAETGVYSTKFKNIPEKSWRTPHEGTFVDYLSMKSEDNVYFFHKRKIYGIGKLINIHNQCIFLNFPDADKPGTTTFDVMKDKMLLNESKEDLNKRFVCTFKGEPFLFKKGVDMDEVLSSNPNAFKMLRALWKLSFIKIDETENKALFDCILKANESRMDGKENSYPFDRKVHERIKNKYTPEYSVTSKNIVKCAVKNNNIQHEMAIEAAIVDYISRNDSNNIYGKWDYVSHQVIASPFKPIDYMDKMDVFGYRYIKGYNTISKYLIIEIKKDAANIEVVDQAMKYVDWIEQEYSHDYSMIEAFIVASCIPDEVVKKRNESALRFYTKGRNPVETLRWKNLRLVEYQYNQKENHIIFKEIAPIE